MKKAELIVATHLHSSFSHTTVISAVSDACFALCSSAHLQVSMHAQVTLGISQNRDKYICFVGKATELHMN